MEYVFTFLEGIASFISPCLLPMIPIYITYFIGENNKKTINTVINSIRIYFRIYFRIFNFSNICKSIGAYC